MASHFTEPTISIPTAAKARKARLQAAASVNPEFTLTADGAQFSFIETALYLSVFGNLDNGDANTEWVKVLFGMVSVAFTLLLILTHNLQGKSVCLSRKGFLGRLRLSLQQEFLAWLARLR